MKTVLDLSSCVRMNGRKCIQEKRQTAKKNEKGALWYATLLGHGHILLTVNAVYDEALYHTNEEMKGRGQENIHVHFLVERPHVLGRCGSSKV